MSIFRRSCFLSIVVSNRCDLPIHCEISHIAGSWEFSFNPSRLSETDNPRKCDATAAEDSGSVETVILTLSTMNTGEQRKTEELLLGLSYSAEMRDGADGPTWSPIADEGLVLQYTTNGAMNILYGQFYYESDSASPTHSDFVLRDGSTPGYKTDCNRIGRGWAFIERDGVRSLHCMTGHKIHPTHSRVEHAISPHPLSISHEGLDDNYIFNFRAIRDIDKQPPDCGACFVYSFAYAFENSIAYLVTGILSQAGIGTSFEKEAENWILDRNAILSCSYSSEGCKGGQFESLILDMIHQGVPIMGSHQGSTCLGSRDEENLIYPKTFVQLQSENDIKHFLRTNGPVLVSVFIESPHPDYIVPENTIVRIPRGTTSESTEWDYVNHGLVITGWGRDETTSEGYWTAFNSWGTNMRIERGGESEWIHKHAIAVIPDFCRGKLLHDFSSRVGSLGCQRTTTKSDT